MDAKKSAKALPPIGELFNDSWELLKLSWKKLLVFNLVMIGISIVFVIVVLIVLGLTVGGGVYALMQGHYSPAAIGTLGLGVIIGIIVALAAAIIIGSLNQAGSILAVNSPTTGVGDLLKKSFHFVLPLFVLSLLIFLLVVPAFFLFIIPGLFVVFFFYFAPYSMVLGGMGVLDSLRRSVYLIKTNFWAMLVRALIMVGLFIAVSFVFGLTSVVTLKVPLLGFLFTIIRIVINIVLSWFMISYSITLYKQAEAASADKEGRGKLLWFVVLAAISVVLMALIAGTVVKSLSSNPEIKNAIMNSAKSSSSLNEAGSTTSMKQTYKAAIISSCKQGGSNVTDSFCTCIADELVDRYSTQELQGMFMKYSQTKTLPSEFTKAESACLPATTQ